jgi:hypothetical protein
MRNKYPYLAIAILTLAACASSITAVPFKGPNGGQAYTMRCTGKGRTMDQCNRKAADVCPQGYDVIEEKKPAPSAAEIAEAMVDDSIKNAPPDHLSVECK